MHYDVGCIRELDVNRAIILAAVIPVLAAVIYILDKKLPAMLAEELPPADSVLVKKGERKLYLLRQGVPYKEYVIVLGSAPEGHKREEGDGRTPEGAYVLDWRNPNSAFHRSLHVSYPNANDEARAAAHGVSPGGMIMIHGQRNWFGWLGGLFRRWDWTDGCIAVTNTEMEEIWRAVADGTPIRIEP